ncbi:molybdate ABC transporter substrate-binding protein [Desulfovibrio aerotolerans]|uniref:Molybdate ABC transporter substrate-binding protein n=1 Tax=Solidesulfovibrio aerotolerans TaxID=295255 RepID=A0A7C9MJ41_9BACT|nr:molybdate ABC transporter substrate-binding protein [Solidesulfovibrio aerotolerans]MYL83149.1 molybdate ABC transporter substrate-binding protein [Solidesulfovibrio aerotolerans]
MKRLLAALVLVIAACRPAAAGEITVFAAASLVNAFTAVKADFEQLHPGNTIHLDFAASGALLGRMDAGAACDVFVSADRDTMTMAVDKRRVDPASRLVFAGNTLVLAVPPGNPARVKDLDSLSQGGVRRIGVGNPETVPAGRYAKRALQQKALWFALTSKLVYYPSVRHVLTAVSHGEVDAGFVYATDAAAPGITVGTAASLVLSPPITYTAARSAAAKDTRLAADFLAYLATPQAKATLAVFGFTPPPTQPE